MFDDLITDKEEKDKQKELFNDEDDEYSPLGGLMHQPFDNLHE